MFKISNNVDFTTTNDTHDIYDIFLGLTGDEEASKEAWVSASEMGFGDKKEVGGYLIEQFNESERRVKVNDNINMTEKMTEKCGAFWTALFNIFDDRKYIPKIGKDSYTYSYALDDRFDLRGSSDRIWLVDKRNGRAQCIQKDEQVNDEFPYTKILDKYLKLSVLSEFY